MHARACTLYNLVKAALPREQVIPDHCVTLLHPLPDGFQLTLVLGREKEARGQAPEASADHRFFPETTRVNTLFAERNLHLVISSKDEIQPLFLLDIHLSINSTSF